MRRLHLAAGALPLILILGACSSGGGGTPIPSVAVPASPSAAAASPSDEASPSGSATAEAEYELKIAAGSGAVTNFLTGEDGKTLYIFKADTANSGKSVCNGDCATNWPPYAADDLDEVKPDSGVTGKLAIITRDDGSKQLAYNGMPLYYFAGDKAAGDTNGQGLNGKWFVATP